MVSSVTQIPTNSFLRNFKEIVDPDIELTKQRLGSEAKSHVFDYYTQDSKLASNPAPVFLFFSFCLFAGGVHQAVENDVEGVEDLDLPTASCIGFGILLTLLFGILYIKELSNLRSAREKNQQFRARLEDDFSKHSKITGQFLGLLFRLSYEESRIAPNPTLDSVRHCFRYLSPKQICKGLKHGARQIASSESEISHCRLKLLKLHVHRFNPWVETLFKGIIEAEEWRLARYVRTAIVPYLKAGNLNPFLKTIPYFFECWIKQVKTDITEWTRMEDINSVVGSDPIDAINEFNEQFVRIRFFGGDVKRIPKNCLGEESDVFLKLIENTEEVTLSDVAYCDFLELVKCVKSDYSFSKMQVSELALKFNVKPILEYCFDQCFIKRNFWNAGWKKNFFKRFEDRSEMVAKTFLDQFSIGEETDFEFFITTFRFTALQLQYLGLPAAARLLARKVFENEIIPFLVNPSTVFLKDEPLIHCVYRMLMMVKCYEEAHQCLNLRFKELFGWGGPCRFVHEWTRLFNLLHKTNDVVVVKAEVVDFLLYCVQDNIRETIKEEYYFLDVSKQIQSVFEAKLDKLSELLRFNIPFEAAQKMASCL